MPYDKKKPMPGDKAPKAVKKGAAPMKKAAKKMMKKGGMK